MNPKFFILLACLIFSEPFFAQKGLKHETLKFTYYNPEHNDSTTLTIEAAYFKKVKHPYMDSVNQRTFKFLRQCTMSENVPGEKLNRTLFASFLENFARQNLEFADEEFFNLWYVDVSSQIIHNKDYVTLNQSVYDYTGGAHPNGSILYYHFDKNEGNRLLLQDFVSNIGMLTTIGEKYFRETREIGENDDLNEAGFWFEDGRFELNENFYFEDGNLLFYFNNYEITAYAGGPTLISIPIVEIKALLIREP